MDTGKSQNKIRATLPTDAQERKTFPIATGLLDYFPDALAAVAHLSSIANDQHNPGEPLHWSREKSPDHADTFMRHFLERGTLDTDKVRHSTKVAWRALAMLQLEIEASQVYDTAQETMARAQARGMLNAQASARGWPGGLAGFGIMRQQDEL